ncbi:hypothetical protein BOTBODRAFT_213296 [Botryobasidium botryosum FD-172 SS1]|uniref:Uncharacterized protein n=1 Tax=Botryobasidium botryosum (strain FD-172 SS1) TaxID=930990 RepID=A0A067NDC3_BOTB1|nr:hypothetical protein BOTBODRAFT_213296 [Botryobasidium botryosum FD-172 SS1]
MCPSPLRRRRYISRLSTTLAGRAGRNKLISSRRAPTRSWPAIESLLPHHVFPSFLTPAFLGSFATKAALSHRPAYRSIYPSTINCKRSSIELAYRTMAMPCTLGRRERRINTRPGFSAVLHRVAQ